MDRAEEILVSVMPRTVTSMENTKLDYPDSSEETLQTRDRLFQLQFGIQCPRLEFCKRLRDLHKPRFVVPDGLLQLVVLC